MMKTIQRAISKLLFLTLLLCALSILIASTSSAIRPVVEIIGPTSGKEGESLTFDGSRSSDPDRRGIKSYEWTFGDGSRGRDSTVTHKYSDNGVYTVTLTVTDDDDETNTNTIDVTISNVNPNAVWITVSPTILNEGSSITCAAVASDPGADSLTYWWDFGDGKKDIGQYVIHRYDDNGSYTVTLTVADGDGGSDEKTQEVTVNNVSPIIADDKFSISPIILNEGESIKCNATASDPGDDVLTYWWDFGDGGGANGSSVSHEYVDDGSYTVTLIVTDDDNGSGTKSREVTVNNVSPTIADDKFSVSPTILNEGESITCNATASDPGNDILSYQWDFGDGSDVVTGQSVNHVYANDGVYIITLTVTDDDGGSDKKTQKITVKNVPPHVDAGQDLPQLDASKPYRTGINVGESISFRGTFADPGMDTYTIIWDFGDGSEPISTRQDVPKAYSQDSPRVVEAKHEYPRSGLYTVTLTVKDDDGESSDRLTVKIEKPADLTAEINFANTDIDKGKHIIDEGEEIIVRVDVHNTGEAMAVGVTPSLEIANTSTGKAVKATGPNPPKANIAGGDRSTFEWVYTTKEGDAGEVIFRGNVTGEDGNSGKNIPDAQADAQTVQVNIPGESIPKECDTTLKAEFSVERKQVSVGQKFKVKMTVTNTRNIAAINVLPSTLEIVGDGSATPTEEPSSSVEIPPAPGKNQFTWTFEANTAGTISFRGRALGKDKNNPDKIVCSDYATSESVKIDTPAQLKARLYIYAKKVGEEEKSVTKISAGQEITVRLTVTNGGEATATINNLTLTFQPGINGIQLQDEPEKKDVELLSKGNEIFEWKYETTEKSVNPQVTFTGTVTGQDKNSAQTISAIATATLDIKTPMKLTVTNITITPNQISEGQEVIVGMTVKNTGGVDAINVTPTLGFEPETAKLIQSPDPPEQDIPVGMSKNFRWTYKTQAGSNGEYTFTGSASGTDQLSGKIINSDESKAKLTIQTPAKLSIKSVAVNPGPSISEGQNLTVAVTVHNSGQADAKDVEAFIEPSVTGKVLKPTPPEKQDIQGNSDSQPFIWKYSTATGSAATISFVANARGKDNNSQTDIFTEKAKTSDLLHIQTPAKLSTQINIYDENGKAVKEISAGQRITVKVTVANEGEAKAIEVQPKLKVSPEQGITLVQEPEPKTTDIARKTVMFFEWIYQTKPDSAGQDAIFTATVEGKDENSQLKKTTQNAVTLAIKPKTDLSITRLEIQPKQISCGQDALVVMTVKNQGGVKALGVTPSLRLESENLNVIPPDQPTPPSADISPGETKDYRWTYKTQTGSQGTYKFIGNASGIDEKSSAFILSNEVTSEPLTIQVPAEIMVQNVVVEPESINAGQPFKIIITIYNEGEATAESVTTRLEPGLVVKGLNQIFPGSKNITGKTSEDFIWEFSTTEESAATLSFTALASGKDQNSGGIILTRETKISPSLRIQIPAKLSTQIKILDENRKPVTKISTEQTIIVSLAVENTGGATATEVTPSLEFSPETGITQKEEPRKSVNIISGAIYTFECKYQTDDTSSGQEVTFTGFIVGKDENSQEEVKADAKTTLFIEQRAGLEITAIRFIQSPLSEGQDIEVVITVRNKGGATALDVKPTLQFKPEVWRLQPPENENIIPPDYSPSPITIPAGGIRDYTWRYKTQSGSKGKYTFTSAASGKDENSGKTVSADEFASDELTIQTPAELAIESLVVSDPDISYGQEIEVVMKVRNYGEAEAEQVKPQLTMVQVIDGRNIQIINEPKTDDVTIAGNSSREFTWKYRTETGSEGQVRFEGKVTGRDVNSKKNLPLSHGTSNDVFIEIPAQLTANVNAFEENEPDSQTITRGQRITVTMTVINEGEAVAENIELSIIPNKPDIVSLHSPPEKLPDKIEKKGTVGPFKWTYNTTAGSGGELTFRGKVTGKDENSKNPISVLTLPSMPINIQTPPDIQVTKIDVGEKLIGINQSFNVIVSIINNGSAKAKIEPTSSDFNISPSEYSITPPAQVTLYGGQKTELIYNVETVEGKTKSDTISIAVEKLTIIDENSGENVGFPKSDVKKEITVDMDRPKLVSALYTDVNEDEKIGLKDKLSLTFNEPVKLKDAGATDFILFPGEFSLESRPTVDLDKEKIVITLRGDEPKLTIEGIEGIYQIDKGAIGIGVYVKQKHLTDLAGNEPSRTESSDAVDIAIEDKLPPNITRISLDKEQINTKPTIYLHVTDENPGFDSGIADPGKDFRYLLDGSRKLTVGTDIQVNAEQLRGDKEMEVRVEFVVEIARLQYLGVSAHQFTVVATDKQNNETQKTITFEVEKSPIVDLATYPNPFAPGQMVGEKEGAVIRYVLNKPMKVAINIYDIAGHLVRRFKDADGNEGINDSLRWNGKTEGGDVVANGIYICELVADGYRKYWRIAVVSMVKDRR